MEDLSQYTLYFAPGCKLLQEQPAAVQALYRYLRRLFGSQLQLYRRCCQQTEEENLPGNALFITLCPTCLQLYSEHRPVRDFWSLYDEYKTFYSLGRDEACLRSCVEKTFSPA